jgi:hypothetical protein
MADLAIKTKILDMLPYMDDRLKNFPREQKMSLTVRIRNTGYDMLELSSNIASGYFNASTVNALDKKNAELKLYIEYAMKRQYISTHQYKVWLAMLVEIGMMIGGLKKALDAKRVRNNAGNKP